MPTRRRLTRMVRGLLPGSRAGRGTPTIQEDLQQLEASYRHGLDQLEQLRYSVADVAAGRRRAQLAAERIGAQARALERQAEGAVAAGRDDLARQALTAQADARRRLLALQEQEQALAVQEEQLAGALGQLQSRLASFRIEQEQLRTAHTAALARLRLDEALTGTSGEIEGAARRLRDHTAALQAKSRGLDELYAEGILGDSLSPGTDPARQAFERLAAETDVDAELTRLKARRITGS